MGLQRKKIILSMTVAFLLMMMVQKNVFTASGAKLKSEFVTTLKELPTKVAEIKHNLSFNKVPNPTEQPFSFPLFPTGQLIVGPSIIVKPTQIIFPTRTPTPLVFGEPPIISSPTHVVLPTIIYNTPIPPTNSPQPTIVYSTPTPPAQANLTLADFGKCLTQKGMILYIINNCSSCGEQKNILGDAFKYVTYVNCSKNSKQCHEANVPSVPSWGKNGQIVIPGGTSLDYLAQVAGCQLPN